MEAGDLARVELWQGHRGSPEALPRNERRLLRLEAISPEGEAHPLPGLHGRRPAGVFRPASPGVWTLVYEGRAVPYSLPAARFERYLEEEGLDHVAAWRARRGLEGAEGLELVSRSLKALLPVGGVAPVDRAVGLPVELVVLSWPDGSGAGLEMRLLVDGSPAPGVLVDFARIDEAASPPQEARTDSKGAVRFEAGGGDWLAAAVFARESDTEDAEWRTFFSTLTFSLPTRGE